MSSSDEGSSVSDQLRRPLKGIRKRKWGKWVSEIRVPGTQDRLWLGTYSSPEAAAMAHDVAKYCLRDNPSIEDFNFPSALPYSGLQKGMSPRSVQKAASDAGMAVDAQFLSNRLSNSGNTNTEGSSGQCYDQIHNCSSAWNGKDQFDGNVERGHHHHHALNISVDDYLANGEQKHDYFPKTGNHYMANLRPLPS